MAYNFNANQYESAYLPHKLQNWEIPKKAKLDEKHGGILFRRDSTTKFIVNENGHILPGIRKIKNSFLDRQKNYNNKPLLEAPRWPVNKILCSNEPRATMGYKGIQTAYLPSNTVFLKAVEIKNCKEANFNKIS